MGSNPTFLVYAQLMWLLVSKTSIFLRKVADQNQQLVNLILLIVNWLLVVFKISKLDKIESDKDVIHIEWEKNFLFKGFF